MRIKAVLLIAALTAILIMPAVHADVFFANTYDPNSTDTYQSFYASEGDGVWQGFTDYYWDGGFTITDFHWWGTPISGNENIAGFQFQIYDQDAGSGLPGSLLYQQFVAGDADATFVENNASYGLGVYKYSLDLTTPFTPAGAGYLWFSVFALPANGNLGSWHWAFGESKPFQDDWIYEFDNGYGWQHLAYWGDDADYAFELTGDATVPEPGTLALFGVGLIGMAVRRFRRK